MHGLRMTLFSASLLLMIWNINARSIIKLLKQATDNVEGTPPAKSLLALRLVDVLGSDNGAGLPVLSCSQFQRLLGLVAQEKKKEEQKKEEQKKEEQKKEEQKKEEKREEEQKKEEEKKEEQKKAKKEVAAKKKEEEKKTRRTEKKKSSGRRRASGAHHHRHRGIVGCIHRCIKSRVTMNFLKCKFMCN